MPAPPVDQRGVLAEDEPFLRRLYASTRQEELAGLGWGDPQFQAFVDLQYRAREAHYRAQHPGADDRLILVDGVPAGRWTMAREPNEAPEQIRLIDVALLPEHRGQGIGTHLLRVLLDEAAAGGLPVELHVVAGSRAMALYGRLGFVEVASQPPYTRMRWLPGTERAT